VPDSLERSKSVNPRPPQDRWNPRHTPAGWRMNPAAVSARRPIRGANGRRLADQGLRCCPPSCWAGRWCWANRPHPPAPSSAARPAGRRTARSVARAAGALAAHAGAPGHLVRGRSRRQPAPGVRVDQRLVHRQHRPRPATPDGVQLPGQRLPPPAELAAGRAGHRRDGERSDLGLPVGHDPARTIASSSPAGCSTNNSPPTTASRICTGSTRRNSTASCTCRRSAAAWTSSSGGTSARTARSTSTPHRTPWRRTPTTSSTPRSPRPAC